VRGENRGRRTHGERKRAIAWRKREREKERVIYMVARDRDEEEIATWKREIARRG